MAFATDLNALVDDYAARLETLNLTGDDQEEYSTMLCRLENQVGREHPDQAIIEECASFLSRPRFVTSLKPNAA